MKILKKLKTVDFGYCYGCETYFDLVNHDSVAEAGHEGCPWRFVNEVELEVLTRDILSAGCLRGW